MMKFGIFPAVDGGGEEVIRSSSYYWNNATRTETNRINIQRTLTGSAFWEDETGRYTVGPGKAMIFTQRENSSYGYPPTAIEIYRHRYISIDPTLTIIPLFQRIRRDFGSVLLMDSKLEACHYFNELFERFRQRSFRDFYHELELITLLFIAMYREQVEATKKSDPIEYGYHLIHNQFRNPINIELIADRSQMSREHFIRAYTARYSETPGKVLQRLRLENARFMLKSTVLPIESIAKNSGFSSSNVFCRAFRKTFGLSPLAYRKEERASENNP
jgi:AraC-like DNA-binding protein